MKTTLGARHILQNKTKTLVNNRGKRGSARFVSNMKIICTYPHTSYAYLALFSTVYTCLFMLIYSLLCGSCKSRSAIQGPYAFIHLGLYFIIWIACLVHFKNSLRLFLSSWSCCSLPIKPLGKLVYFK